MPELFYKTTPFSHQIEGVKFAMNRDRVFLGDDQGLGKSKQAIDVAINNKIYYNYKHCLIVCGINSLRWNWYNEVLTHSDEQPYILGMREIKRGPNKGKYRTGTVADRKADLRRIDELPYFLITNIETFRDSEFAKMMFELTENDIQMCILDEAHKCKSPTSQQTKGFLKTQCEYRMVMTGTPIMNTPLDMYVILRWLGLESHSYFQFEKHYAIKGGFGGHQIIGYKHLDQLKEVIDKVMLRRLKKDVLDLPEKIYVDDIVEMLPKQSKLYDDVKADIIENIDKVLLSPSPLAGLIRLRQCTGYTGILSSEIEESAKLDRLEEIVEDVVSCGDKCIVFSNWTQITDQAFLRLKQYNPVQITGNVGENDRELAKQKFQEEESCKVIIGTTSAMGTGITLTAATTVIFLDEPWNRALYDQAVDRAHRIGQKNNVTIHNIICKDTIDQKVHDLIIKKGIISDVLIDGSMDDSHLSPTEIVNMLLF